MTDISKHIVLDNTDKCMKCNKKTLILYKCKCEKQFCRNHKYSDNHNCSYNYKLKQQEFLQKSNPIIIPNKINQF